MITYNILIVEDESIIAEELKQIVTGKGYNVVGVAHRYEEAVDLLKNNILDLVLIDIRLSYSKSDGINLAEHINDIYKIPFIYITANADADTVYRAKHTHPDSYILKPFNEISVITNIEIALHKNQHAQILNQIVVRRGSKNVNVDIRKILFLKADTVYTEIHTTEEKVFTVRNYLKHFTKELPAYFLQVHRSYVINTTLIDSYSADFVFIKDNKVPIGGSYRELFRQKLLQATEPISGS